MATDESEWSNYYKPQMSLINDSLVYQSGESKAWVFHDTESTQIKLLSCCLAICYYCDIVYTKYCIYLVRNTEC